MNRDEFLRTLREALSGEIPPNIIEENIRYYDAYIADEVRKGRTEEEVIEELGGARVIAKTIIDVAAAGGDAALAQQVEQLTARAADAEKKAAEAEQREADAVRAAEEAALRADGYLARITAAQTALAG